MKSQWEWAFSPKLGTWIVQELDGVDGAVAVVQSSRPLAAKNARLLYCGDGLGEHRRWSIVAPVQQVVLGNLNSEGGFDGWTEWVAGI